MSAGQENLPRKGAVGSLKYDVFISYSRKDIEFTKSLERALRGYTPPSDLPIPRRRLKVFRDQSDMLGVELTVALETNLRESAKLAIVCSPDGRASPYVNHEIEYFARMRGPQHLIPILLRGVPSNEAVTSGEAAIAFPSALVAALPTPLAADFRGIRPLKDRIEHGGFEQSWYKMLADIYSDYEISRAEIEQREKRRRVRQWKIFGSIAATVMAALVVLSIWALTERREAVRQRDTAISRQLASQSGNFTSDRPDLALLLDAAAYQSAPTLEARQSLHASFLARPRLKQFLWGHAADVTTIAFSPDNRMLAAGSDKDTRVVLWDRATGRRLLNRMAHGSAIKAVAFSPDGKLVMSGEEEGLIKVWDATNGAELRAFGDPKQMLATLAVSSDGRRLVAGLRSGTLQVWNFNTGEKLGETTPGNGWVFKVVFSPDGRLIASGSWGGTAAIWDGVSSNIPHLLPGHRDGAKDVAFGADSKTLAVAYEGGKINLWNAETGEPAGELAPAPAHDKIEGARLAFSPDGTTLALGGTLSKTVSLWDLSTLRPVGGGLRGHESGVHAAAFSGDGRWFASVGGDGMVRQWETGQWTQVAASRGGTTCLSFSPDDRVLATCDRERVALWEVEEPDGIADLRGHSDRIGALRFSPDGSHLASASQNRDLIVWNVRSRRPMARWDPVRTPADDLEPVSHGKAVRVLAFSPDGKVLASGGREGKTFGEGGRRGDLFLWSFLEPGPVVPLEGHTSAVSAVAFSPDGNQLASADSRRVLLWDLRTRMARVLLDARGAFALAFDPGGSYLAAATGDNVALWKLALGEPPRTLQGHQRPVRQLLFSPDGKALVSGSFDGTIRIWDPAGAGTTDRVGRHSSDITSMAMSPDGRFVASGSRDRMVNLWGLKDAVLLRSFGPHDGEVHSVDISPNGRVLAVGTENGGVTLWDADHGEEIVSLRRSARLVAFSPTRGLLATAGAAADPKVTIWNVLVQQWADQACERTNRNLTCGEWRQYLGDMTFRPVCPKVPASEDCNLSAGSN